MNQLAQKEILVDNFGRRVNYVRLSVTDRCDFRCVYCMSESMTFLPKESILSLEEIGRIAKVFSELGVEKIRLTGGEPLVRRDVMQVIDYIGGLGLKDFAMTTNGSQLPRFAKDLKASGLKRLNISLDSLNPEKFKRITRTGSLQQVLDGIDAAINAGFKGIKLNAVIMKGRNEDEVLDLVEFARHKKIDISFIEEMPLGVVSDHERGETYCSSDEVRKIITSRYSIKPVSSTTAGPSRYYQMPDSAIRLGFISPHSHNFCGDCNRVRVTVEGRLLLCLGNEHSIDLRPYLRNPSPKGQPHNDQPLKQAIIDSMAIKPERHHFTNDGEVQVVRMMNMTGG